jgi:hypothetical protein
MNPDQPVAIDGRDDSAIARETTLKLLAFCRAHDWAGYDPYDALNSRIFRALPFLDFKLARLVLTQGVKRFPMNLRPILMVPKTPNPKGIALFLSSLVKLSRIGLVEGSELIGALADKLLALRSTGMKSYCWGYNFDWQTRGELVPKGSPNIICTAFAANALLDAYEQFRERSWLDAAQSAAEFVLDTLLWRDEDSNTCFSYTPLGPDKIHNANLLGAALLCRVGRATGHSKFFDPAFEATRYSVHKQHNDGGWDYGELPSQRWIDNFHTGYNLVAIKKISQYGRTTEFNESMVLGLQFFLEHFFREDGAPRYYHKATYPIDIHSVAQSIITLVEFREYSETNVDLAHSVLKWALNNMWADRGYFYFQKLRSYTVRIPFMRWSEAWMLLALATLLNQDPRVLGTPDHRMP